MAWRRVAKREARTRPVYARAGAGVSVRKKKKEREREREGKNDKGGKKELRLGGRGRERERKRVKQTKQDMDDVKHDEGLRPPREGPDSRVDCVEAAPCGGERGCRVVEHGGPQKGAEGVIAGEVYFG